MQSSEIPKGQRWFIRLLQGMGYHGNIKGMCHAVAMMTMQAFLAGRLDQFDNRLKLIGTYAGKPEDLNSGIQNALEKGKQRKPEKGKPEKGKQGELTEEDRNLIDIMAFFDALELYQVGLEHHIEVFDTTNFPLIEKIKRILSGGEYDCRLKINALNKLLKSIDSSRYGGQVTCLGISYSEYDDETVDEIIDIYLKELAELANKNFTSISIHLSGKNHAINACYDSKAECWFLVDANRLPSEKYAMNDIALREKIKEGIVNPESSDPNENQKMIGATIYAHNNYLTYKNIRTLKNDIKQSSILHKHNKENTQLENTTKRLMQAGLLIIGVAAMGSAAIALLVFTGITVPITIPLMIGFVALSCVGAAISIYGIKKRAAVNYEAAYSKQAYKNYYASEDTRLDKQLGIEHQGENYEFGPAKSPEHREIREKYYHYLAAIKSPEFADPGKGQNINELQEAMIQFEQGSGKPGEAFQELKKILTKIARSLPPNEESKSAPVETKNPPPANKKSKPASVETKNAPPANKKSEPPSTKRALEETLFDKYIGTLFQNKWALKPRKLRKPKIQPPEEGKHNNRRH